MADLQSTNRVKIGKARETTFGVMPVNPIFKTVRQTSSSLAFNPQTTESNEITSDRQVTDLILTGYQAGGDIGGEMSFQTMDEDLEEALQGTWLNKPVIAVATSDIEISDVSATTLTVAAGGAAFVAGLITLLSGFTTPANNRTAIVSSSTGTSVVYPSATFTAEAAAIPVGATVRAVGFRGASGDIAAVTVGGNGLTSTLLDFTTLGLTVGEWVRPAGFGTLGVNDFCRISAIAAHKIGFDRVPAMWQADTGTGNLISVYFGDLLINGVTKRSNVIERQYLDHSPVTFEYFMGQTLSKFSVDASAQKSRHTPRHISAPLRPT